MKLVFLGTPDFSLKSLKKLYENNFEIEAVVTNTDKEKGRGRKLTSSPVKEFAIEKNLKLFQPLKIRKNEEFEDEIRKLKPDFIIVVAYGKILPKSFLDIPKYGAINVHGSLLPNYRGASPIQYSILNGDKETGITTMFMDEGMDTGDIIRQEKIHIQDNETTGELWEEMGDLGSKLLIKTLNEINEIIKKNPDVNNEKLKKLIGAKKQGDNFTLAPMLTKEMAEINWNNNINDIYNLIRGLNPIMGAYTYFNGNKVKIWSAEKIYDDDIESNNLYINYKKYKNGDIILKDPKIGLFVKSNGGIISIIELQAENSKKMNVRDFLNGNKL